MTTRVRVPSEREAPSDLLRLLREIEPTLDLYYAGRGRWFVLNESRAATRMQIGQKMVHRARRYAHSSWDMFQRAALMADGFSLICELDEADIVNASWARDHVQRLMRRTPEQCEQDAATAIDEAEGEPRRRDAIKVRREYLTHEAPKVYSHFFGRRLSVAVNGLRRAVGV